MARKTPVLPGQSRSAACSRSCLRLRGHKGEHRATLNAAPSQPIKASRTTTKSSPVKAGTRLTLADGTVVVVVEVHEVVPARTSARRTKSRASKAAATKPCRVKAADGRACVRSYGHKQAGKRHLFESRGVVELPEAGPEGRDVQAHRPARRGRFVVSGRPSSRLA